MKHNKSLIQGSDGEPRGQLEFQNTTWDILNTRPYRQWFTASTTVRPPGRG